MEGEHTNVVATSDTRHCGVKLAVCKALGSANMESDTFECLACDQLKYNVRYMLSTLRLVGRHHKARSEWELNSFPDNSSMFVGLLVATKAETKAGQME